MSEKPVVKVKRKRKRLYDPTSFELGFNQEHKPFNFVLSPLRKYLVGDIEPLIEEAVRAFLREETRGLRKHLASQRADIRRLKSELETLKKQITGLPEHPEPLSEKGHQGSESPLPSEDPSESEEQAEDFQESQDTSQAADAEPEPANDREAAMTRIVSLLQEGLSHRKIAANLNANAVPTLSGRGKWHRSTVSKIIREEGLGSE